MIKGKGRTGLSRKEKEEKTEEEDYQLSMAANHPLAMAGPSYLTEPPPVRAASDGPGIPWIGHATKKTGSSGGKVTWSDLKEIGVKAQGEPYLCIGEDYFAIAGVPVALLEVRLAQQKRDSNYQVTQERLVNELPDGDDGYRYVLKAALLLPAINDMDIPATVATYTEDLHPAVGFQSRCLEQLRKEVARTTSEDWMSAHPTLSKLPPPFRVVGELVGILSTSKAGNSFVKRTVETREPSTEEIAAFIAAAQECGDEILAASEEIKGIGGGIVKEEEGE